MKFNLTLHSPIKIISIHLTTSLRVICLWNEYEHIEIICTFGGKQSDQDLIDKTFQFKLESKTWLTHAC